MDSEADRRHSSPGFPHSDIRGSRPACGFPRLIAASYVLHRLLMPGHSPYTLSSLTITLLLIHMVFHQDLFNFQRTQTTNLLSSDTEQRKLRKASQPTALIGFGGADWNRTSDPLLAKQVLSQLSYSPVGLCVIVPFEPPRETFTLETQFGGPG